MHPLLCESPIFRMRMYVEVEIHGTTEAASAIRYQILCKIKQTRCYAAYTRAVSVP